MNKGQSSKNRGIKGLPTSKPFCDCQHCECRNCPDVLEKLALKAKDSKRGLRPRGPKRNNNTKPKIKKALQGPPRRPSILDSLDPDRNCECEIVARAIRPHIHMNMGMSEQRHRPSDQRPSHSKDIKE